MYICICKAVSDRQIRQAVRDGARSVDDLQAALEVSTGCGCCAEAVEACLEIALSGRRSERDARLPAGLAGATAAI